MYTVLNTTTKGICFVGNKPILVDTIGKAKEQADFLKSVNKECEYVVCKLTKLAAKGEVQGRFTESAEAEAPKRKRVKK